MASSADYDYVVNYISGLDKYKFSIQNIRLILDEEKISFTNKRFDFSISINQIAVVEFMKSPFKMPEPLSPVNLNTAYSYFRLHYFDGRFPKSILFMMNSIATDLFNSGEEACKGLFYKLSKNCRDNCKIISPWGENKHNCELLRIKTIYPMAYLGGHPQNRHKFSKVDFYVLKDSFYIDGYINENHFSAFEIPFNQIKLFELTNRKHSSLAEKIFSLGAVSNKSDTGHIVFTDTQGTDISIYLSLLVGASTQEHLDIWKEVLKHLGDEGGDEGTVLLSPFS